MSRLAPAAAEPFADEAAGADYFSTDYHHRFLVNAIREQLAKARGFVLVTGDPPADGEMLGRYLTDEKETGYRVAHVRCRTGMVFDDLVRAYSRQLGLRADDDSARLWALLSHLMLETRNGITRILIVENAETLDIRTFDELYRFARLDDPHLMSVVLLSSPSFAHRLEAAPLNFLKPAIVGHVMVQRLHAEEVGAFIHYQLNTAAPNRALMLSSEQIAAIANAANGDPAVVNRLARQVLSIKAPAPEPPTVKSIEPPAAVRPVEPIAAKPVEPVVVKPVEPIMTKPPEPLVTKPAESIVAKPTEPVMAKPAEPLVAKPTEPIVTKSAEPNAAKPPEPLVAKPIPVTAKAAQPIAAKPPEPLVAKPPEPLVAKPIPVPPLPKLPAAALPMTPKPLPAVKVPTSELVPSKPAPAALKVEPAGEDPIPDIPLVLPSAAQTTPERTDANAVAARTIRAARAPAPSARKALSDAEHHVKPAIAKPPVDMPGVPLAPAVNDGETDAEGEALPLPSRRTRPQIASGVAAVIYLAATVLVGAVLLYIFDPGLRRDQVPLLSATATIPPPPSEGPPIVQPVATAPVPEPPLDTQATRTGATGAPIADTAAAVTGGNDVLPAKPAPGKDLSPPAPAAETKPAVAKAPEVLPAPAPAPVVVTPPPARAAEAPNEADIRSAASVEPAAAPPRPAVVAATEPATKLVLPSEAHPIDATASKLTPPSRESDTVVIAAPPPVSTVERPANAELAVLVRRGDEFLAAGDIISARRFFERAAQSGDSGGALGLGKSYDPLYLRQAGVRGVGGDPLKAASWYSSAAAGGNAEAALRLKRLQAAYPQ